MTSPEFFAQMEYFVCVLVQLSLICWFGNEITTASELIRLSLYESDWLSSSPRFKSSMILTMIRMQRPVFLSIGKFTPLTLATLVAVFVMYTFAGISAHISSLITINKEMGGRSFNETNKTCYDYMPYHFYIPFSTETKGDCGLAFAFMDIGLGIFAWLIGCHDGVFVSLLNCLKTQLLIVGTVFKSIRERSLQAVNLPENHTILHDENNFLLEKELYRQLTHCTEHLRILLVIRRDLENIFTFVTLSQTLASLLIFASCLYVASTSEQIRLSLYESDWLSSSPRFKRSIILTMIRMQRPVYLSIGKFTPLTLVTLVAVCRGSFSCFALFKSVQ
ncbi:hypothetical protein JTB14_019114 [Gonioctena quinquepunctata]|nr:hypothetical protein JTB14_019114 [Gonioctena quinquepunctata]